tara:strand:- start:15450 stop:15746 length:297 start_codon:yes stop_codon:yes gene_type:complete
MDIDLENDDYFLCSWNGTDITQIHTKESLIEEYKETGLLEDKDWNKIGKEWDMEPEKNVIQLMDYLIEDKWLFESFQNDNMAIMYIKMKDNTDHDNDK